MHTNLASILRQAELISATQESSIIESVQAEAHTVPSALLAQGIFTPDELVSHLAQIFGLEVINVTQFDYVATCQKLGLRDLITRYQALPVSYDNCTIRLAVADPSIAQIEDDFRFTSGKQIELMLADQGQIQAAIRRVYGVGLSASNSQHKEITQDELASLVDVSLDEISATEDLSQDDAPVTRFINQILLEAVRKGVSDIHFEPYEESYRVRFRCDGILVENSSPSSHLSRRLSARLKIMAKLDIAERRLPQDGRIKLKLNNDISIDMRVSSLPTLWGEKIVLRLLDSSAASLDIDKLGYSDKQKELYLNALKRPQGMILMTGPTGSGKTVSLYSGLNILNTTEKNISTAEDPVEINLNGVNQVQVAPKIGFTFAHALRSFLRQDPDIVMVGEIRDLETAEIAVKAAQTGHLVLSTLHTNSAAETVVRLGNMGIENFNLASSLSLIIAQRLARRLCPHCKEIDNLSSETREEYGIDLLSTVFKARLEGCNECTHGYSGRIGIYEVMPFTRELSIAILKGATVRQIEQIAVNQGMDNLATSGIKRLEDGTTSLQELTRVLYF
ncbi:MULTISPECIES: type IV-A pilus assembly ATPase PilB [Aliivibrio]|uniref:Type IV-A pilus assembly ATPase PilB n=1 Tax=Aliivibrio finisterrensis TaxID=511998 RepID=A0A4Q5KVT9_9GAMM|nr:MULTISPECIES: type IV-A pilus assembly ATPase PilB [Aliivibrio]MDD9178187.1 type IV-A pilus assembly ATPase PilB [Aliivibrio sp. A6]RYU52697.1 type IV-A pilus assembly ATPase PilB [Aliivibrio finisterrensis]RYU55774.1 type IV-A pilus assembly ATPase PilB [Aliivibrio finisterrensis]RYU60614.1 type IV-A pilus assembly ATPase PilB [Aliivibrio finisterrensis]RYU66261.1 type IV-A pilus assembly ATPase PilB [Aliivibrio finisterrensis]